MDSIALFNMLDAKLDYVSQRQSVIANNVANGDTPGFIPSDIVAPNFKDIMAGKDVAKSADAGGLRLTNGHHIPMQGMGGMNMSTLKESTAFYGVKPSGNAVDMEEQMLKAAKNQSEANIAINLYTRQIGFLKTAIGANR